MLRRRRVSQWPLVKVPMVDVIDEEIVRPGYLGYTSNAEAIHDAGRLLVLVVALLKLVRGESINNDQVAALVSKLMEARGEAI